MINLLEETMEENLCDLGLVKDLTFDTKRMLCKRKK